MQIEEIEKATRRQFYAYRNGIVADALRQSGDPHHMIMGCQLTDVARIAQELGQSAELANIFWGDKKHRECRMIAPMLYPAHEFSHEQALAWCRDVESIEIADVLCHSLLRKLNYAPQLFYELLQHDATPLVRYTAFRLLLNLILMNKIELSSEIKSLIQTELPTATPHLVQVLHSIEEEFNNP